jgi:PAS domain S-box-containing protein
MSLERVDIKTEKEHLNTPSCNGNLIIDCNGKIIYCNQSIAQLLGYSSSKEILNKDLKQFVYQSNGSLFDINNFLQKNSDNSPVFYLKSLKKQKIESPCSIESLKTGDENIFIINIENFSKESNQKENKEISILKNLEKKLEKSEERFKKISELSTSSVCIQTQDKFLFVNPAWEKLIGFDKEEAMQMEFTSIVHSDFVKLIKNRFKAKFEGKKIPDKFDIKLLSKLGKEIWVNTDFSLIEYEGKKAIISVLMDITDMKKNQQALKNSKKKFQSLFYENTSIMILVDPQNGNIVDANEAACKFYGYPKSKIITLSLKEISLNSPEEIETEMQEAMHDRRKHFFYRHKLSNNEIRDVELYSGKVEMKEGVFLYSIVHDITARKEAEEALKKSEQELKQLNAQKDRFFSIIAHDLRGPLSAFMQLTEYMQKNYSSIDEADFEKYFNQMFLSASGTFKLLENLLVWTRSQLGALQLKTEVVHIHDLCDETISILMENASAKNIQVVNKIPENLTVLADENTVATVLRNLITNAIKFTKIEGSIVISSTKSLKANQEGKSFVNIHIKDNGVGIKKEVIPKLFSIEENYHTSGTSNEKGTGLGLILCKELVNKNGGDISVKSKPGEGSTFSFSLFDAKNEE